jgi:heptosyltransferase I
VKILVLKPSSLGDVVQSLPVARLLRRHLPQARIHWWLNRELVPLLEGDPDIEAVIPFDRRRWATPSGWPEAVSTLQRVRREHYDWVIDLQALARSAVFGWLASGSYTIGLQDFREGAPAFYDRSIPPPAAPAHAVDWYLKVLRELGIPVHSDFEWLPVRSEAQTVMDTVWPDDGSRWVALQPGARWLNKRWPVESFAQLAAGLLRIRPDVRVVVLGGAGDVELGRRICEEAGPRALNLAGRLTLPTMVAWVRRCALMITNDTGPMHVAAALKVPVVALFGPTAPAHTGPYGQLDSVLRLDLACSPCQTPTCHFEEPMACLRRLPVSLALDAAIRRLSALK